MNKVAFVILHYETIEDTRACLESLIKFIDLHNAHIIIVDNGSITGKLDELESQYRCNNSIVFLRSEENLGFAKGNNLGFKYAKDNLDVNFIILTNSDTVYKQDKFIENIEKEYEFSRFDVAGPKIISMVDGKNQNPVSKIYNNYLDVKKRIFKFRILMLLSYLNIDSLAKSCLSNNVDKIEGSRYKDIQLHGACLIFSKNYINNYSGLFDKTFMYGEESILKYIVERDKLKMIYIDEAEIYHKEGASTDAIYGKGVKKRRFYYKWNIKGCKLLANLMKNA